MMAVDTSLGVLLFDFGVFPEDGPAVDEGSGFGSTMVTGGRRERSGCEDRTRTKDLIFQTLEDRGARILTTAKCSYDLFDDQGYIVHYTGWITDSQKLTFQLQRETPGSHIPKRLEALISKNEKLNFLTESQSGQND
jgi:hypothetical protein